MSLLERIYFFHSRVQSGRFPNSTNLIHEFEISPATAHRDLAYLRDRLLAPLAFNQKRNGFYYTDEFQLPFEDSPSMTLILGLLGNLAEETGLAGLSEISAIRKKLQGVLFPGQRDISELLHCEWNEREIIKGNIFKAVLKALREQWQLKLQYRDGSGKVSERIIEPMKLVNYQGRWYLLAWCTSRQDRRMFHLARMEKTEPSAAAVQHTLDKNDDWLTSSFGIFKGPISFQATIQFTGTAAEIIRHQHWHPDQKTQLNDKGLLLTLPVADDRELIMKILQFGGQAEVIAPAALRTKVEEEIKRMAKVYSP